MRKKTSLTIVERAMVLVPEFKSRAVKLEHQVVLRGQSASTLNNYIRRIALFVIHFEKLPEQLSEDDYTGLKLNAFLKKEKDKLQYDYDFGDNWEHTVVLEKILPFDDKLQYPVCVAGRMSCPPEDCGGAWGYMDMVEVLKQPGHEEIGRASW